MSEAPPDLYLAIVDLDPARTHAPVWVPLRTESSPLLIGRAGHPDARITWKEPYLSGRHFTLTWEQGQWRVQRCQPEAGKMAPNVLFHDAARQHPVAEPHAWGINQPLFLGQGGKTAFVLLAKKPDLDQVDWRGRTVVTEEDRNAALHRVAGTNDLYADRRDLDYGVKVQLRVFQQELPECLQAWADSAEATEEALFQKVSTLVGRTLGGGGMAVVFLALPEGEKPPRTLHTDTGPFGDFRPSRRLLGELARETAGTPLLWKPDRVTQGLTPGASLTTERADWVLALRLPGAAANSSAKEKPPLRIRGEEIVLYLEARETTGVAPEPWLPFLRTVGVLVASVLEAREQQRIQGQLAAYFSPRLRQVVRERPREDLEPAIFNCTVLFCDRRGSSKAAESADMEDLMLTQLKDNQSLLGEVTRVVFENEGAVADFAGDCVLGFWGWPVDQAGGEHARAALETARQVAERFQSRMEYDESRRLHLPAFRIGVSTGRMAVGNVGPVEQMKIGVFGNPVNFGARLEGLGKQFRLPVIVSEETVKAVPPGAFPLRKLCFIRPAGFDQAYPIYELVLPRDQGGSGATPESIAIYEEALSHFLAREWDICLQKLGALIAQKDEAAFWLLKQALHFQEKPPLADWRGEIVMEVK